MSEPAHGTAGGTSHLEEIEAHVGRHYGPVKTVLHEVIPEQIHLDVLVVPPGENRRFWTFVTSGMSDLPMTVDLGLLERFRRSPAELRHAELAIALPEGRWSDQPYQVHGDGVREYAIDWLKMLARYPHYAKSWFGSGHTIPAGTPPSPIGPDTAMNAFLFWRALSRDSGFDRLQAKDGTPINFYAVYPLYQAEVDMKVTSGAAALVDRMQRAGITEVFDETRRSL